MPEVYFVNIGNFKQCKKRFFSDLKKAGIFTLRKRLGRFILNAIAKPFSAEVQQEIIKLAKIKDDNQKVYLSPESFDIFRKLASQKINITACYPNEKKCFLGLTFDIDNKLDYKHLPYLVDDLEKNKLVATINIITHGDYSISSSKINDLKKIGFEIGLHGDTHNSALSFFPKPLIKTKILRAVDKLGFLPYGFRSPGLSFSKNLIEVLDDLGFQYDSSLATGIGAYHSIEFPYVFRFPGFRILEVPLFMQDYNFFVKDRFPEKDSLYIFEEQIRQLTKINGVGLINTHPSMIIEKRIFWKGLLNMFNFYRESAWIGTVNGLLESVTGEKCS